MPENTEITDKVVSQVKKEIQDLGATSKENFEKLQNDYVTLKEIVEKQGTTDPITEERLNKLAASVATRQNELDKVMKTTEMVNKRMDEIEVAMQRSSKFTFKDGGDAPNINDYMLFEKSIAAAQKRNFTFEDRQQIIKEPNIERYNQYTDIYLKYLYIGDKMMMPDELRALQVGVDADGGYTVTPYMSNRISVRQFESDPVRQLASVETIGTDAYEMWEDYDEAGAEWEGETVSTTDTTTPKMGKKRIPVHILATRPRITQMLLDDSNINIENWLSNKVADKFSRTEAASYVTGNGVGKPRGFGTYPAWTTNGTYEHAKIEQQNMGHATQFTTDGLLKVKYRMIEQHLMRGTWLTNRLNVLDIMLLKDGDGQYIWRPGLQEGQPSLLLGLPLRMSTTVATTAAAALAIYLADWKACYLIVDRQGINVQRDPYTQKPFVEFYTRKRVGGDVINYQAIKIGKVAA